MREPDHDQECGRVLRLDIDWRWHRPKHRRRVPRGEPPIEERPLRCLIDDQKISTSPGHLPFDDVSIDVVECGVVFAFARDDEGLASELGRIVRSGGVITLDVPSTGMLAGLDSFNLYRYLVDTTRRGLRPFETSDLGWRRHYGLDDLGTLLGNNGFEIISHRRTTIALAEAVRLTGFLLFRWLRPSRNRYRVVARAANRLLTLERHIVWRHGFWLEMTLRKRDQAAGIDPGRLSQRMPDSPIRQ